MLIWNLQVTTTQANGFNLDDFSWAVNVKVTNSSGAGTPYALDVAGLSTMVINCEGISTNGVALRTSTDSSILSCYLHDSATGIDVSQPEGFLVGNIVDTCTLGIDYNGIDRNFTKNK